LSSGRNLKVHASRDQRHIDVGTECELRVGDKDFGVQIFAVALEPRILFDLEHDENVTARAAAWADVANAAHRHVLTGGDAGGNAHGDLLFTTEPAFTTALLARRGNHRSFAGARWARRNADHLSEEAALRATDFAAALTRRALGWRRPRLGAASFAAIAWLEQTHRHRLLDAAGHLH